jgi:hypothetical protein
MTAALATAATARVSAQTQSPSQFGITAENGRASAYLRDLASPSGLVRMTGGAMVARWRDDRAEFGDELAYRMTRRAVGVSVEHGLAAVMHRDPNQQYQFCECRGVGARVAHALAETFTDRREDGSRTLAVPRLAAGYAEGFTSLAWQRDRNVGSALTGATLSLGSQALFNVFRELTRINLPIHP